MTVASTKPNMKEVAVSYLTGSVPNTSFNTLERNFLGSHNAKTRTLLLSQLDDIASDLRRTKALLLDPKGKENKNAFILLGDMISSEDAEISRKAKEVFLKYIDSSITRQNLVGTHIEPENATEAEQAFESLTSFLAETNSEKKYQHATNIANASGFLYQEMGDDRQDTTWKRGRINPEGKAGRDKRLFNFFHNMQKTESGKLMHQLAIDEGLQETHQDLYAKHIEGKENGLSDKVRSSLVQQIKANSPALNPTRIFGDKSFTKTVEARDASEVEFLNSYGRSADFSFSIENLEASYVKNSGKERKDIIVDFMAGFELLSFRKASLIKGNSSSDPILTRAARKIEDQQKEMLNALKIHAGRDPQLAEAIEDMFKAEGTSIFMYHMVGALNSAEKSVSTIIEWEAEDIKKHYGADAVVISPGKELKDSFQDLMSLKKNTEEALETQTIDLANKVLTDLGRKEILDQDSISDFERYAEAASFSPSVTSELFANANDTARWDKINKANPHRESNYFGLDQACEEFKNQFNLSVDPQIVYVRDNFERIYGTTMDKLLDQVKKQERFHETTNEHASYIESAEDFGKYFLKAAKKNREAHRANPKRFEHEHAITKPGFSTHMAQIVQGEYTLKPEKIIAEIVNKDNKAHKEAGFGVESIGHLERLLLSEEIDNPGENSKAFDLQIAERTLGIFELERQILGSRHSNEDKKKTIEYIHHTLLGDKDFKLTDLANYKTELDTALGNGPRAYKKVISETSPDGLSALLKDRYKLDDISIISGNVSRRVLDYMRKESELLISGFEGNIPDGLFNSDETNMIDVLNNLRTKISSALKADNMEEEASALQDMVKAFTNIGFPVDQLIPSGTLDDENWRENMIFNSPIFMSPNHNQSDIMQVLIQIWQSILDSLQSKK